MQRLIQQIMKFGIVGVLAFVIDYGLMVALTELVGLAPVASATVSFIVSVVFNYVASMRFVFSHKEGMSKQREFVIFVVLSVIGLVASATVSFIVSVVFNYVASMRFVFSHKEGMSKQREFVIFVVLSVIGLLINDGLMWAGTELVAIDYRIVKIGATAVVMVWNFVTRKLFLDGGEQQAS